MKKYISIDPSTGLYDYIGHYGSMKDATKDCDWKIDKDKTFVGKEANRALDAFEKGNKKLRISLKDAIIKAKLAKAILTMVKTTNLKKKLKKK